jgi:twitching motility protein PilT
MASRSEQLDELLQACVEHDASDIHLVPGLPPSLRVHGLLEPLPQSEPLAAALVEQLALELAQRSGRPSLGEIGSLDGAVSSAHGVRFRFNLFWRQRQVAIALRRLEDRFRSLEELGLRGDLYSLCGLSDGLVVVAGPTGAGKSTTLAAMIDRINQTRPCHVVTIEDPIEYLHTPARSVVNQRQVGSDTENFYEALVAAMRQDPDVILVGEIRDLNTIRTAITAAETGHLVFTTVHAGDCVGTIERLISVFPAEEQAGMRRQLSLVLRCVVTQHLVVCDGSRSRESSETREDLATVNDTEVSRLRLPSGTRRRVVTSEVLMVNSAVANLIATGKSNQIYSAMETGSQIGMQTLEEDLARLWHAGMISEQTASTFARNPSVLRERFAALRSSNGNGGVIRGGVR